MYDTYLKLLQWPLSTLYLNNAHLTLLPHFFLKYWLQGVTVQKLVHWKPKILLLI